MKKMNKQLINATLAALLTTQGAFAESGKPQTANGGSISSNSSYGTKPYVVDITSQNLLYSDKGLDRQIHQAVTKFMNVRYFLTVPKSQIAPMPSVNSGSSDEPIFALNYQHQDKSIKVDVKDSKGNTVIMDKPIDSGLRLFALNGSDRIKASNKLAESGLLQTGDIVLSYRKEWNETLRYSHIQLGTSHAGMIYIDEDTVKDKKTGKSVTKKFAFNIDMPLDTETVGEDKRSKLTANHYVEAPLLHVLRLNDITEQEKENLKNWSKMIAEEAADGAYKKHIIFNSDYSAPKYTSKEKLDFVQHLGNIALDQAEGQMSMYCSEFAWALLSLRKCDPTSSKVAKAFRSDKQPDCIEEVYSPMQMISGDGNGMAEGPLSIAKQLTSVTEEERATLLKSTLSSASSVALHISSGHKEVEKGLVAAVPFFYPMLEAYYLNSPEAYQKLNSEVKNAISSNKLIPQLAGAVQQITAPSQGLFVNQTQIAMFLNLTQKPNYSPTSMLINALLPDVLKEDGSRQAHPNKAFNYIGTVVYVNYDVYTQLTSLLGGVK